MESLWEAIGRRREGVIARGTSFVRRTRETGADILGRAEREAGKLQGTLSSRRSTLNGKPLERLERRVLQRIEDVLDRVGLGLRLRIQRLTPGPKRVAIEPDAPVQPEDATLVDESETSSGATPRALEPAAPPRAPSARATGKKRIRVAVGSLAEPAESANGAPEASKRAKPRADKAERPAARRTTKAGAKAPKVATSTKAKSSTRWVERPAEVEVEELGKLPVKTLLARIPALDDASCRALLAHEKQTKKRKTVVDALAARLPS